MAQPPLCQHPSDDHNPIYRGAYAYGKTSVTVHYDGVMARAKSRRKPREEWLALKPGTHEGYLDWERAEAIRRMVSENIPTSRHHGAPKHGDALLAGLVRCRRWCSPSPVPSDVSPDRSSAHRTP